MQLPLVADGPKTVAYRLVGAFALPEPLPRRVFARRVQGALDG